jgi:two-component system, sensor histidine kinase
MEAALQPRDFEALARELSHPVDALGLLTSALRHRTNGIGSETILDEIELGLSQVRRQLASLIDAGRAERCLNGSVITDFPLMPLLTKLALETGRLAHDNRVSLSIVPTRARVTSDPAAIEIILRNLLVNGLFFAQGGRVLLGCRRRGNAVQMQVWDNGVGIALEDQAIIYEPRHKLTGDGDGAVQGLGIGLTLVRELAGALGHHLDLRSQPSLGSLFSLTLPRASDQQSESGETHSAPALASADAT